ncbi:acyl carrier protein [Thermotalea metallivorans]|uniref:Acyl carrier protein n=1 Tax=Thermotalea metallivorans TaxID=520762 RepID=A0A140L526_9FIRM|nr:acyl carrier protein [Thermotalea metallivorans]KXG75651.1 Acyl carrier protein [Thermotalea metallivorans]
MVFEKIKEIIIEQLGLEDDADITMQTSLMRDLEADSLDAVEIIMAIEDEFDVEIPDEDAEAFKNIGDIVRYVEEKM